MKKILYFLFSFVVLFSLAGCNEKVEQEEAEQKADGTEEKQEETEKTDSVTLLEIFEKTMDASSSLESYSVYMETEQKVTESPTSDPLHMNMTMEMDVTTNPEAVHQKLSMSIPDEETFQSEIYFSEEGYFMYEPFSGTWMKMPKDMFVPTDQIPEEKTDPYLQIQQFKEFIEDFSFQTNQSEYILSLNISGDEFFDYVTEETLDLLDGEEGVQFEEIMNSTSVNQLDYKIVVDKNSFLLKQAEMIIQLDMDEEGEELSLFQKSSFTYKNYNEIDQIIVPEEVVNNAIEANF